MSASDEPVKIPALGRQGLSIGCLYDLTKNQAYVTNLWTQEELEDEKLNIVPCPSTEWDLKISNNQSERSKALNVSAAIR